jgi:Uma2 family endonuclease
MSTVLQHPQRHAISAQEYLRMAEAGVFAPDARLELIEGEIVEMAAIGSRHAGAVKTLNRLLVQRAGNLAVVSVQDPVVLANRSVPQPDLALLKPRNDDYSSSHPGVADVLLAIEVSDTTLAFDLGTKVPLYARSGIPELWVVDLEGRTIRIYREPAASGYQSAFSIGQEDSVECVAVPQVCIGARELFSK